MPVVSRRTSSRLGALRGLAASTLKRVPLVAPSLALTERELSRVEERLWREVRSRVDASRAGGGADPSATTGGPVPDPRQLLAQLLTVSIEQSAQQARARLFAALVGALQPDEARILAALADGSEYPVVHVASRGPLGATGPALLENASTVGRAAGVALPDWVPAYVTHLQQLQLVSVGPESVQLADGYEILLTESVVRQAQVDAGGHSRLVRRSLRLSPLGRDLWQACAAPEAGGPSRTLP